MNNRDTKSMGMKGHRTPRNKRESQNSPEIHRILGNDESTAALEPQGIGKLECLCRMGAGVSPLLSPANPSRGILHPGTEMDTFCQVFFLPLEYKRLFLQASFTKFNFFCFNGPAGLWPGRRRDGKLFPLQKCFFQRGM